MTGGAAMTGGPAVTGGVAMTGGPAMTGGSTTKKPNSLMMNTTVLAYLGDSVYEVYVRKRVIDTGQVRADRLHHSAVRYVRAGAQAKIIKAVFDELPPEQQALVKRARNHRSATKPKNADPVEYKWATAFEALAGYLFLEGKTEEMEALFARAARIVEDGE